MRLLLPISAHTSVASSHTSVSTALAIAFGAALFGAIVAWTAGALTQRARSRRYFRNALRAVVLELEFVATDAKRRAEPAPGVRRDAPLPSDAWRSLLGSSELDQLDEKLLSRISEIYRQIEAANYIAAQSTNYLMIATATADPLTRDTYLAEATRVATEPF